MRKCATIAATFILIFGAVAATAQLPPDAVMLGKVKISEQVKSSEFDPVTLEPANPELPTWEHEGVTWGSSDPASKETFLADPAKYIEEAEKARWKINFAQDMSTIWCPVTDEISPGGGLIWHELGLEWESCCQFCNDTKTPEDFPRALERLNKRAMLAYDEMGGAKYVEGARSPVEGAINLGGNMPAETAAEPVQVASVPEWLVEDVEEPTWANPIGRIVENRCIECHRAGAVAPMELMSVGLIRKWSKNLKQHIEMGTMPPWPADKSQQFANARILTPKERELLLKWIDAGYPPGDEPYEIETPGEWWIGEPDLVIDMEEYVIPDATDHVANIEITPDIEEDKWVVATEIKPTDVFLTLEMAGGPLGAYHRGNPVTELPEAHAFLLRAGEPVKVRIFYAKEPGWEDYDDGTQFALKFADDPAAIKKRVHVARMANDDFTIPAGSDNTAVTSEFEFEKDGTIIAVNPVARQRAKTIEVKAVFPGGNEQTLLTIPRWDPNWHFRYTLPEPLEAPEGTRVQMTIVYDNSDMNALNPDPAKEVKAGPGGELAEGWLYYTLADPMTATAAAPDAANQKS